MESPIAYSALSVLLVSLASFAGLLALVMRDVTLRKAIFVLVSVSVGVLFGDVFIHLLPEIYEETADPLAASLYIAAGIMTFFVLEKFFRWGHVHDDGERMRAQSDEQDENKVLGSMVLLSDGLHNFIDGLIITASFMAGTSVGIATTVAVVLHEIPQEIGDYGVLLHAGYSRFKALLYNFFSALAAFVGIGVAMAAGAALDGFIYETMSFAAGGFIYIAGSDLVPELQKSTGTRKSLIQLISILAGFAVMFALLALE